MNARFFKLMGLLIVASMVFAACAPAATPEPTPIPPSPTEPPITTPQIDCSGVTSGDEITVVYQWSGAEEENFNTIIQPFVDACGVTVTAQSTRDDAVLDTMVKSTPPDVLFWPNFSPLKLYTDKLLPLDTVGADGGNYASFWADMGTVSGSWLAIPVKADVKTIVWYSPTQFLALGYTVPTTFAELGTLVDKMAADGNVPWSMGQESGSATGWTGSDFIQDVLLATEGPAYVNGIISGSVAYNDPGVVSAYQTYQKWASDAKYTVGGSVGTLNTSFADAILKVFSNPSEAMMVKQSGFAGGNVATAYPDLVYGTDYDFFQFPGAQGLQGGADFMYAFSDQPAAKALIAYLTSEQGGVNFAAANWGLSPNKYAAGNYTDVQMSKLGDMLATTSGFTFDMGDAIGAPFNTAEWLAIVNIVQGQDIQTNLDAAAVAQALSVEKPQDVAVDCSGVTSGDEITVVYQWSGAEEENFNTIIQPFVDACGVTVTAQSTRDDAVLDTMVKSTPPDVLFWPNFSPLKLYTDKLLPLDTVGADGGNYASFWADMGTVSGSWLAIPVKADVKTIVWYSPTQFLALGYTVPTTFAELGTLVDKMAADGNVPWSMGQESGSATGWTGSDFIQDVLLATEGPAYVNGIISGSVAYNDPGVVSAYQTYQKWASDAKYTVGGSVGTLNTSFADAILKVFSNPSEAMMVKQSGFAGGNVATAYPDLVYGTDYDFFQFPGAQGLQGGADFMYAFSDQPAAKALIAYLTSEQGGVNFAAANWGLSPNKYAAGNYTDVQMSKLGDMLATTSGFTFDMGDAIGAPFNAAEWLAIVNIVQGQDIQTNLDAAAVAQAASIK